MKDYEVIAPGIVIDGKPAKVGSTIQLDPKGGEARCGIRFKQLKPKGAPAKQEPAKKA